MTRKILVLEFSLLQLQLGQNSVGPTHIVLIGEFQVLTYAYLAEVKRPTTKR